MTRSKDKQDEPTSESSRIDRRHFIKTAAMGAGLAGSAAATGFTSTTAQASEVSAEPAITRTEAHKIFADAPIKEFAFPAQGGRSVCQGL